MRGLRFRILWLVALAACFSGAPMFGASAAFAQEISNAQILRSWDGSGIPISAPDALLLDSHATLQRIGGSRLLLQVDANILRRDLLVSTQDDVRRLLREARIGYTNLAIRDDAVVVRIRHSEDVSRALTVFAGDAEPGKGLGGSVTVRDAGDNVIQLTAVEVEFTGSLGDAIGQSVLVMEARIRQLGLENAGVRQAGPNSIEVVLPGLMEPDRLLAIMPASSILSFRLILSAEEAHAVESKQPADAEVLHGYNSKKPYSVYKHIILSNGDIRSARAISDARTQNPAVGFWVSIRGAWRLDQFTKENLGRPVAIVLDNSVMATAVIREPISRGIGMIEGSLTIDEARVLSFFMRSGILPMPLIVVEKEIFPLAKQ